LRAVKGRVKVKAITLASAGKFHGEEEGTDESKSMRRCSAGKNQSCEPPRNVSLAACVF
jgi:hypothetical protein